MRSQPYRYSNGRPSVGYWRRQPVGLYAWTGPETHKEGGVAAMWKALSNDYGEEPRRSIQKPAITLVV